MKRYLEIDPGLPALRYLFSYGVLTWLSKRAAHRKHRMFTQLTGSVDRHVIAEGYFEAGVLDVVSELAGKTGHTSRMIDIGANIGNHSVGLSDVFGRIECVEPHPILYKVLQANLLLNNIGHASTHNVGLANEDSSGTLVESSKEHGLSRVKERSQLAPEVFGLSAESFGMEHAVDLVSADAFVRRFSQDMNRTFIKIDVEGMEEEIMLALRSVLQEFKPLVGFEWFTSSQKGLEEFVFSLDDYELWGVRMHDKGGNYLKRAFVMLFSGRYYTLERLERHNLDEVYPLAFLVPKGEFS